MDSPLSVNFIRLIVLLPLLGAAVNFLGGAVLQRELGKRAISIVGCGTVAAAFAIAVYAWVTMLARAPADRFMLDHLWRWIHVGALRLDIAFWLDPLSMVMVLIVTGVGGLIHVYSTGYMHEDESYWRFFGWLNLFTFAMLVLVLADNLWLMFVGWEGVGLCSFALIGFWYKDLANTTAGNKAFIVNRVGDWAFVVALYSLFTGLGTAGHATLVIRDVAHWAPALAGMPGYFGMSLVTFVTLLLFVGAAGKSAQIPLYVWLPDAMAGPTPVSALIHAATMVTAGVYMVARLNFLFALSPAAMTVVAMVGCLTAIFAASIGFFQYDIKKVLAYSTVSQLGFMFIGVGVGAYWAGIFHLMTHAFFKACLFLGSGSVILACHHEQDMRKMGGLREYTPITRWTYLAACVSIAGFPFAAGFYSKDEILWKAFTARGLLQPWMGPTIWLVGTIAALGTSFYMFRSYFMTFTGKYRGGEGHEIKETEEDPHSVAAHQDADVALHARQPLAALEALVATVPHEHGEPEDAAPVHRDEHAHGGLPHESPKSMTYVLIALAAAAVLAGFVFGWPAAWGGSGPMLEHWLAPSLPAQERVPFAHAPHSTELLFQLIGGVLVAGVGWLLAYALYHDNRSTVPARLRAMFPRAWALAFNKYYVDEVYDATVVRGSLVLSRVLYWIDQNVIDGFVNFMGWLGRAVAYVDAAIDKYIVDGAVNGLASLTWNSGSALRRIQTGHIQSYLYGALGGAIAFVIIQYVIR